MSTALIVSLGVAVVVGGLGGWLTEVGPWYLNLDVPPWKPPNWLFGPAWTVIFLCAAFAAAYAWRMARDGEQRGEVLGLFALNAICNILWSAFFFKLRRPDWALVEVVALWLSIVAPILVLGRFAPRTAWLLAPYLVWVSFAAILNYAIARRNAPFQTASLSLMRKDADGR